MSHQIDRGTFYFFAPILHSLGMFLDEEHLLSKYLAMVVKWDVT